jgi:hypothetical protein
MLTDLIEKIGKERLEAYKKWGFLYTLNNNAATPYLSLKNIIKDIEIWVHDHDWGKGDNKYLISTSKKEPFGRIGYKGIIHDPRFHQDEKTGRYIYSGSGDLNTILKNLDLLTERCSKGEYF